MRLPVPKNKLVALTLTGAVLTALVAVALAGPLVGLGHFGDDGSSDVTASQLDGDAPTPNQDFDPTVQTQSRYGEHEDDEYDEHEEDENEDDYEDEEYDEHEDEDEDEDDYEDEHEDTSAYAPRDGDSGR